MVVEYLRVGAGEVITAFPRRRPPRQPWDASREDYSVVWSEGRIVAIEILNPRWLLEQGREIVVTLEDGTVLRSPDVERAITPRRAA